MAKLDFDRDFEEDKLSLEEYLGLRNKLILKIIIYLVLIGIVIFSSLLKETIYKVIICVIMTPMIITQALLIYYFKKQLKDKN